MLNFIYARDLLSAFGLSQKKIHQILNKESETKLEELLQEEETISECKSQNQKLLEFLCKKENLTKLIHYATRNPEDPTNKDQAHKYPFMAADLLSCSMKIADALIQTIEKPVPEEKPASQDDSQSHQENKKSDYKSVEQETPQHKNAEEEEAAENKAIQDILQKVKDDQEKTKNDNGGAIEKQTMVEDLNELDIEDENATSSKHQLIVNKQMSLLPHELNAASNKGETTTTKTFESEEQKESIENKEDGHNEAQKENTESQEEGKIDNENAKAEGGSKKGGEDKQGEVFDLLWSDGETEKSKKLLHEIQDEESKVSDEERQKKQQWKIDLGLIKLPKKEEEEPEIEENYDFSIMDDLFSFLDQERIEPILCGYFNKIVQSLLGKAKMKLLNYILLQRKGDIYLKLLNHLEHHSLAQLLVELLEIRLGQLQQRDRFSSDFDKEDTKTEDDYAALQPKLTKIESRMYQILQQKRTEVVLSLIQRLSGKNRELDQVLNAQAMLLDMAENENTFGSLVHKEPFLKLIEAACDIKNRNQAYALNVLQAIIKEYPEYDRVIGQQVAQEFQQTIGNHFQDLTYSCLLVLKASDSQLGEQQHLHQYEQAFENQAGATIKRFGQKRMRALELIRQELQSLSKYPELNTINSISSILRQQIIQTMLDVIEDYEFSSVACQQALLILDFLKVAFDDQDIEILKAFIRKNLSEHTYYKFASGRRTTNAHLATIIKMGIALKRMTHGHDPTIEADESENEDKKEEQHKDLKHLNDPEWNTFCTTQLRHFEIKWTKKLEDYNNDESEEHQTTQGDQTAESNIQQESAFEEEKERNHDAEEREQEVNKKFEESQKPVAGGLSLGGLTGSDNNLVSPRTRQQRNKSMTEEELEQLEKTISDAKKHRDDWELMKKNNSFEGYQFWKVPDQYNVDDLIKQEQQNQ